MGRYIVTETEINGMLMIEPEVLKEKRGYNFENFSEREFEAMGIDYHFVEDIHECYARGVLIGLNFQQKHTQGRLVRVTSGAALCVGVDLRPSSESYGASVSYEISKDNRRMLWIPPQFAFGVLTVEADTEIITKCTDYSSPEDVAGIAWDDQILCINWQFERYDIDEKYLNISKRDKKNPAFRTYNPLELWK